MLTSTARVTRDRLAASSAVVALLMVSVMVTQLGSNPALVSRLGLRQSVAESIAKAVETLGSVPWWALVIIGGGVAGVLLRLVIRYGWRYAAAW